MCWCTSSIDKASGACVYEAYNIIATNVIGIQNFKTLNINTLATRTQF